MGEVLPLPNRGDVFEDLRGEGRTLRVSWHSEERTLVLSMWHLGQCRATFRLPSAQVPDLVRSLVVAGLTDAGPASEAGSASQAGAVAEPVALRAAPDVETTTDDAVALLRAAGLDLPTAWPQTEPQSAAEDNAENKKAQPNESADGPAEKTAAEGAEG